MKGFRSEEKQTESDHQDDEHDRGGKVGWASESGGRSSGNLRSFDVLFKEYEVIREFSVGVTEGMKGHVIKTEPVGLSWYLGICGKLGES